MHELPIAKSIFDIVMKHAQANNVKKVFSVNLQIGALSDLQSEWMQRYFDRLSRGTVADGAKLKAKRTPAVFRCGDCQQSFEIGSMPVEDVKCSLCNGDNISLISGTEYRVSNMEAQ